MYSITNYGDLTDNFILDMEDNLFMTTTAYRTFGSKNRFVSKIHEPVIRFKMLKNIVTFTQTTDN